MSSKSIVRNICVIAHVDHGKTTLSDSLLSRAHLLADDKAGNARTLDYDEEEIARGITINSSGITLVYDDWPTDSYVEEPVSSTSTSTTAPVVPVATVKSTVVEDANVDMGDSIYLGNLPWAKSPEEQQQLQAQVEALFSQFGVIKSCEIRPRRGFAHIVFESKASVPKVLQAVANSDQGLKIQDRSIVVEVSSDGPWQRLENLCDQNNWKAPVFSISADDTYAIIQVDDCHYENRLPLTETSKKDAKRKLAADAINSLNSTASASQEEEEEELNDDADNGVTTQKVSKNASSSLSSRGGLIVNLIDCPGHVDFSGEVTAALRITDGSVVVVDPFDSKDPGRLCPQTETVLRQALQERVKPILLLNKIDKGIMSLQLSPEQMYQQLRRTIEAVNDLIIQTQPAGFDFTVTPENGTVIFGSGYMGWAFNLTEMANQLAHNNDAQAAKILKKIWGDNYLDPATGKWQSHNVGSVNGQILERGFCTHILKPIYELFRLGSAEENLEALKQKADKLKIRIPVDLNAKEALKEILKRWIPVADCLLRAVVKHLPSPAKAQTYRIPILYEGSLEDDAAQAMLKCDANGPLMMYISKMVSLPKIGGRKGALVAYGRVFSGTLRKGETVRILGPSYEPGNKFDCFEVRVQGLVHLMAGRTESVYEAVGGDLIGVLGLEKYVEKSATVTSSATAHRMKLMKFSVSPVVRIAIEAEKSKNPGDAQKIVEAMKTLSKSDPTVLCYIDDQTQQKIMAGAGELHLEVRLKTLKELAGVGVVASEPVVQYCETITDNSGECLAKTTNKHNRIFVVAEPLNEESSNLFDKQIVTMATDLKERIDFLYQAGWNRDHARKVIAIEGNNVLVNLLEGIDLSPIRDNVIIAFREICQKSVMARETLQNVRFNITDAKIHADSVHRRADQIVPAAKRVFQGAILKAKPKLLEPIFKVDIQVDSDYMQAACTILKGRRGDIISTNLPEGGSIHTIEAYLPVAKSFGFNGDLRGASSGRAFQTCSFSHWREVPGDPLDKTSYAANIVKETRERKGLDPVVPEAAYFLDQL